MLPSRQQKPEDIHGERVSIYLTFDDGPDPGTTPGLLDILADHDIRASFFILGRQAARYPWLVRRIRNGGHVIGNHTWHHFHPLRMASNTACREVYETTQLLEDQTGQSITLFRPPYGYVRPCMLEQAWKLGQRLLLWDRSAIDWGWLGHSRLIARRLHSARPGETLLLHDAVNKRNKPHAMLKALPTFLKQKINEGCRFEAVI